MTGIFVIPRYHDGHLIDQRAADGFFDVTALCTAVGCSLDDYLKLRSSRDFLRRFARRMSKPASSILELNDGGRGRAWAHPKIAVRIAAWASPAAVPQLNQWIGNWLELAAPSLSEP